MLAVRDSLRAARRRAAPFVRVLPHDRAAARSVLAVARGQHRAASRASPAQLSELLEVPTFVFDPLEALGAEFRSTGAAGRAAVRAGLRAGAEVGMSPVFAINFRREAYQREHGEDAPPRVRARALGALLRRARHRAGPVRAQRGRIEPARAQSSSVSVERLRHRPAGDAVASRAQPRPATIEQHLRNPRLWRDRLGAAGAGAARQRAAARAGVQSRQRRAAPPT